MVVALAFVFFIVALEGNGCPTVVEQPICDKY